MGLPCLFRFHVLKNCVILLLLTLLESLKWGGKSPRQGYGKIYIIIFPSTESQREKQINKFNLEVTGHSWLVLTCPGPDIALLLNDTLNLQQ